MADAKTHISNFSHLVVHDGRLARIGALAEHYFADDPNTCLLKLRQLDDLLLRTLRPGSVMCQRSRRRSAMQASSLDCSFLPAHSGWATDADLKSSEYWTPVLIFVKFAENKHRQYEAEVIAEYQKLRLLAPAA